MGELQFEYQGLELDLFRHATRWKAYFSKHLQKYIHGDVLEIGAGHGVNSPFLIHSKCETWTTVEPDTKNHQIIRSQLVNIEIPLSHCLGTIDLIPISKKYDCILYIDVLEHIQNDEEELQKAQLRLKPGGSLVVLCPAHNFLFSEFDRSIGHYRRYNKSMYQKLDILDLKLINCFYLDSLGLLMSAGNRFILKKSNPSLANIQFWDKSIVPLSKILDPIFAYSIGKSIVGIWRKGDMSPGEV